MLILNELSVSPSGISESPKQDICIPKTKYLSPKQNFCAQYINNIFPFLSVVYTQYEPAVQPATPRSQLCLYLDILELEKYALAGTANLVKPEDDYIDATIGGLPKKYSRFHGNVGSKTF